MLMSNQHKSQVSRSAGLSRRSRPWILLALLFAFLPVAEAQVAKAQRAIERLEKCSKQERQSGCVDILKVEQLGKNKLAIKAQVRGARIIWYEYNKNSGKVKRTN